MSNARHNKDSETAKIVASVICSSLFKAAMFGADANWQGLVIGCGADVDVQIDVICSKKGDLTVCVDGAGLWKNSQKRYF